MQWQQFGGVQRVQIHGLTCMERVEIDRFDRLEIELRRLLLQGSRKCRKYCLVGQWFIQVRLDGLSHLRLDGFRRRLLALGRVNDQRLGRFGDIEGRARLGCERRWLRLHHRQSIKERLQLGRARIQFARFVERFRCLGELTGFDRGGGALQAAVCPSVTHARLEALPLRRRDVRGVIDGVADRHTSVRHVCNRSCKRCASMLSRLVRG
jgi:hypothetical protein